jgi:hypothetical protein
LDCSPRHRAAQQQGVSAAAIELIGRTNTSISEMMPCRMALKSVESQAADQRKPPAMRQNAQYRCFPEQDQRERQPKDRLSHGTAVRADTPLPPVVRTLRMQ